MNEDLESNSVTPGSGNYSFDVINSAASSWSGDISGFNKVVEQVGSKYNLFETKDGVITNFDSVSKNLMVKIIGLGADNPNVSSVVDKLVSNVISNANQNDYKKLMETGDEGEASGLIVKGVNEALRQSNLGEFTDDLYSVLRDRAEIKMKSELPPPKKADVGTQALPPQEDERQKEEDKREKEDQEAKEKKEKEAKDKKGEEKKEGEGETKTDTSDKIKNEFEKGDEHIGDKRGDNTKNQDPGHQKTEHEPNQGKSKNDGQNSETNEGEIGQNGEPNSSKPPTESRQNKPSEGQTEQIPEGGQTGVSSKTNQSTPESLNGEIDSKITADVKSVQTKSEIPQSGQPSSVSGNAPGTTPAEPSLGNTGNVPSSGVQPPTGASNLPTGKTGTELPTGSTGAGPGGGKIGNLRPGNNSPVGSGGNLQPGVQNGLNPNIKLPKINKLTDLSGGGKITRGAQKTGQLARQLGNQTKVVSDTTKVAAEAGKQAVKLGADLAAKGTQALAQLAARGIALLGQGIATLAAALAPIWVIVLIIVVFVVVILGFIIITACPGQNPGAQIASEKIGADKMAFNDKLGDQCKSKTQSSSNCNLASGNGSKDTGVGAAGVKCLAAPRSGVMADPYARAIARALKVYENSDSYSGSNSLGCFGAYQFCPYGAWADTKSQVSSNPSRYNNVKLDSLYSSSAEQQDFAFAAYFDVRFPTGFSDLKNAGTNRDSIANIMDSQKWCQGWTPFGDQSGKYGCPANEGKRTPVIETYLNVLQEELTGKCGSQTAYNEKDTNNLIAKYNDTISKLNPFGSVGVQAATTGSLSADDQTLIKLLVSGQIDVGLSSREDFIRDITDGIDPNLAKFLIGLASKHTFRITALGNNTHRNSGGDHNKTPTQAVDVDFIDGYKVLSGQDKASYDKQVVFLKDAEGTGVVKSILTTDQIKQEIQQYEGFNNFGGYNDGDGHYHFSIDTSVAFNSNGTGGNTISNSSSDPCLATSGNNKSNAKGSLALLALAKTASAGIKPDGFCYTYVGNWLNQVGFAGIKPGVFKTQPMTGDQNYAKGFAEHYNIKENALAQGIVNLLDANPNLNPYDAPAGAIVVVSPGSPGTSNKVAGDITVADGNGNFYNGGEMDYKGASAWNGSKGGSGRVLGIYVPAT